MAFLFQSFWPLLMLMAGPQIFPLVSVSMI